MAARFISAIDPSLRLQCPCCHKGCLTLAEGHAYCDDTNCAARFPLVEQVPVLINPTRSIFRESDFSPRTATTFKATGTLAERIGRILPSSSCDVSRTRNYRRLADELRAFDTDLRSVLVVGSGDGSAAYLDLATVEGATILETDVSLAGSAQVVCDASDLPFADGSFSLIVCQAVLEHVLEPDRCVQEMHRVMRPGGIIYAATPFMQQVHMGEFDFMRFSRSGHRWLFRHFDELESGVATGPTSVLVWSVEYFLLSWTSELWVRRCIKALTRIALGWMTLIDRVLARRPAALDASGGFYFIGRRSEHQAINPRDMISYYSGSDSTK